jgi:hypothetical protein
MILYKNLTYLIFFAFLIGGGGATKAVHPFPVILEMQNSPFLGFLPFFFKSTKPLIFSY